jgi:DNA-binding CsgD family transcriptional regulator
MFARMEHTSKPRRGNHKQDGAESVNGSGHTAVLTPREQVCLQGVADGLGSKEIAHELGISRRTVEHHIASAQGKMKAKTRAQAVARAVILGLVHPIPF